MVGAGDLKCYHSAAGPSGRLGGAITATQVQNGQRNNLFANVTRTEQVSGKDYYKCVFFKNTHATESMDNFKLWLSNKRNPNDTVVKWGFDKAARESIGLDGVNDYINCTNDATLWSQALAKFSMSIWVYFLADSATADRYIISHGNASNQGFRLVRRFTDQKIAFQIKNAVGTNLTAVADSAAVNNVWYHVVCTYDNTLGSANLKIYIDSVLQSSTGNLTESINLSDVLTIGTTSASNAPNCYVKGFGYWRNKALTQTEVNGVFDGSDSASRDYHLSMDEQGGSPQDDESGSKEATLTNGAYWNFDAQQVTSVFNEPDSITWNSVGAEPSSTNFRKLSAGGFFPVWVWYHVEADAESRLDDSELFSFKFTIPQGGTGSSGGGDPTGGGGGSGSGGNPPPANADYKIAFAGDWGCENETDDVISLIKNGGYDGLIGCGDNAYSDAGCWLSKFNSLKSKFLGSAYGNHEYDDGDPSDYKPFFGDNKTYYTFKFQNIFFMIIDSNIDMDAGGTQNNTIKNALLASLNDNTITWRIGVLHFPMFGADSKHSYNDGNSVQAFHKLFQDNGVSFVLAGHNHNWQRTKQVVYNSGNPESPTVVASSSPYSRSKKGFIHVVSGTGGHDSGSSLYALGSQPGFQAYQNRSHNGIWEIVASNNAQTLTCSFVDIDGKKYDTIVINA